MTDTDTAATTQTEEETAYHQAGQAVVCVTLFGARVVKNLGLSGGPGHRMEVRNLFALASSAFVSTSES